MARAGPRPTYGRNSGREELTKDRMDRTGQAGGWIADSEVWHLQRRAAGVKILHVNGTPRGRG